MRTLLAPLLAAALTPAMAAALHAQPSITDTRLLAQPAMSATEVAFIYAGDLWISRIDGTDVRRLTTADGDEQNPVFSPDGKSIAFSANYDGNIDVYVIPASGGTPKRLTYHPDPDIVQGFTPDGKSVLFTSGRSSHTNRYTQLFTVSVDGGRRRWRVAAACAASACRPARRSRASRWTSWRRPRKGPARSGCCVSSA